MDRVIRIVLSSVLLTIGAFAQGLAGRHPLPRSARVFVATTDSFGTAVGEAVEVRGGPPWDAQVIGATSGGRFLRHFGQTLYVVNEQDGSITRLREDGTVLPALNLGPLSFPQDIYVTPANGAYVTRRDSSELLRFDLMTGTSVVAADLGPFAAPDETLEVRTMHADGDHLFVQLGFVGLFGASHGALAVLDMGTGQFVDVDPSQPGIQAIDLAGAPPHLKMQIRRRRLFVSTTLYRMDKRGGIEMVDLDQLASIGFALTEEQVFGVDLGGFALTGDDAGYFVFHTDIVPSTHLHHFTISGGLTPGPDLITLLGDAVDSLAYDGRRHRLYLPTGDSGFGTDSGVFVLDTLTLQVLASTPFDTGMRAHDIVLSR